MLAIEMCFWKVFFKRRGIKLLPKSDEDVQFHWLMFVVSWDDEEADALLPMILLHLSMDGKVSNKLLASPFRRVRAYTSNSISASTFTGTDSTD